MPVRQGLVFCEIAHLISCDLLRLKISRGARVFVCQGIISRIRVPRSFNASPTILCIIPHSGLRDLRINHLLMIVQDIVLGIGSAELWRHTDADMYWKWID